MNKETISVRISQDAANGLKDFCAQQGISVTALIECTGLDFLNVNDENLRLVREQLVERARKIDQQRRTRKQSKKAPETTPHNS